MGKEIIPKSPVTILTPVYDEFGNFLYTEETRITGGTTVFDSTDGATDGKRVVTTVKKGIITEKASNQSNVRKSSFGSPEHRRSSPPKKPEA